MINNKPNIFEYATKELSQDAVFMYLYDCYNSNCTEESELGESFLRLIYTTQNKKIEKTVKKLIVKKQYHNIDILVLVEYEDNSFDAIIIEDKTYSSEHDNQLKKYYDDIKKYGVDGRKANNILGVYFKLGKPTASEKEALKIYDNFEYNVLGYDSFLDFLKQHKETNLILLLIYEFYQKRLHFIEIVDRIDFSNPIDISFEEILSDRYSQDAFVRWFIQAIIETKYQYHPENQYGVMNFGRPCTQYRFVFTPEDENDKSWNCKTDGNISNYSYFFRIDSNSKGWYIAINQYCYEGDKYWEEKRKKRDDIRADISKIIKKYEYSDDTDNRGKKESKICLFHIKSFEDAKNLIPLLKEIHHRIIELVVDK